MANVASNIANLGLSAAGVAVAVIGGITIGSIADMIMANLVSKLGMVSSGNGIASRGKAFLVVSLSALVGFGAFYGLSYLPIQMSGPESVLLIAIYVSTQSVGLAAAQRIVSSSEEAAVAGVFTSLI